MASLEEMRKKILEMENKRSNAPTKKTNQDNRFYPFWKAPDGEEVSVRFLPDGDTNNTFFWAERELINIPFSGVIGAEDEDKPVTVKVPCVEMWPGRKCPIHQELRPWYKQNDPELEKLASVYWKKKTYLYQGFVRSSKLVEQETPENPIRLFWVKPQVHKLIKPIIMDKDVVESPTHYQYGLDFYINKEKNGQWHNYASSRWSRATSPLTQDELDAIEKYGLYNLREFLPKEPTDEEAQIMFDMFTVSLEGGKYDPEKWGAFYRPRGLVILGDNRTNNSHNAAVDDDDDGDTSPQIEVPMKKTVSVPVTQNVAVNSKPAEEEPKSVSVEMKEPAPVADASSKPQTANEILAMLRKRENKS